MSYASSQYKFYDIFQPLRAALKTLDNNKGFITQDGFRKALATTGVEINGTNDYHTLFRSFDVGKTGEISTEDFVTVLGYPLILDCESTIDEVLTESASIILMKPRSGSDFEEQWSDMFDRVKVNPCRGVLNWGKFKAIFKAEITDGWMNEAQLSSIFEYLDINHNGKVSVITMRFLVSEIRKKLGNKGQLLTVLDLLKQSLVLIGIRKAEQVEELNTGTETACQQSSLLPIGVKRMTKVNTTTNVELVSSSNVIVSEPEDYKNESSNTKRMIFTWPLFAMIFWVATCITFLISLFGERPLGEIAIDIEVILWSGILVSIGGALHGFLVWPFRRGDEDTRKWQVGTSMLFFICAAIYFGLGLVFLNTFWWVSSDCFSCSECENLGDTVCWGSTTLGYQDTCPCAVKGNNLWDKAQFADEMGYSDCNSTLYASNYFEGDVGLLKSCMFYDDGLFAQLGPIIICITLLSLLTSCWGFLKDLKDWKKYGLAKGSVVEESYRDGRTRKDTKELKSKSASSKSVGPELYM